MDDLEAYVNFPFNPDLLKDIFSDPDDLRIAHPFARNPFDPEEWRGFFPENSENTSLVFMLAGTPIGHTSLVVKETDIYLCYVLLKSEYRGLGIAEQMILETEEFARLNYTHTELLLHVHKTNPRAMSLYQRLGYTLLQEFQDKLRLVKTLRLPAN